MKRFLLSFMLTMCIVCSAVAQSIVTYTATSYAIADVNTLTGVYTWSNWERCRVVIAFDYNRDIITIYSNNQQRYVILDSGTNFRDNNGGEQIKFQVIDQDGDRGTLRLRIEQNGNSQLYVDFNNVAWCYNVVRND